MQYPYYYYYNLYCRSIHGAQRERERERVRGEGGHNTSSLLFKGVR
jgi:hypothetical protein